MANNRLTAPTVALTTISSPFNGRSSNQENMKTIEQLTHADT
jgi:hypothetical protein